MAKEYICKHNDSQQNAFLFKNRIANMWFRLLVLLLCANFSAVYAQQLSLRILTTDADSASLSKLASWPLTSYSDSISMQAELSTFVETLLQNGYLAASIDTLIRSDNHYTALLHAGQSYRWVKLSAPNIPEKWLSRAGFRERLFQNKPIELAEWQELQQELTRIAANNGFPFARVRLDSFSWQAPAELTANIRLDKGPLVFFEQLEIVGDLAISINYLEQYLGLIPGTPYNESVIQRVPQRLRELAFLQLKETPKVQFIENQARLILELTPKKASRLDLIVGVLPNSRQTGRLLVTGQLDGALQNAFGKGESISVELEQLRAQSPELALNFNYPYLLQLPFGLDAELQVYRRDTNFINVNWRLGLDYLLSGGRSVQAFWGRQQTNLLGVDSLQLAFLAGLPDTLDIRRSAFGLGFQFSQLDYRNNPRQGWSWQLQASAGQKTISRNTKIQDFGFGERYDSLQLKSAQYSINTSAAWYQPLGQRAVLKFGIDAAAILAAEPVLANEQFRIGGNRLLRGFDEESIFATNFAILTTEYRFLLATNSYLYGFFDWSRVDRSSLNTPKDTDPSQWYQGFGAGITFETRPGLFGLSLAFGRQDQQPFDLGAPKVHFGFVSLF